MSARDKYHQIVKIALQKESWDITHDPYPLRAGSLDLEIDIGAEKVIAAERGAEKIAVEIKSFLGASKISEFYGALGQFITYRAALEKQEPDRTLYLAAPQQIYDRFFIMPFIQDVVQQNKVPMLVYNITQETISQWKK